VPSDLMRGTASDTGWLHAWQHGGDHYHPFGGSVYCRDTPKWQKMYLGPCACRVSAQACI